MGWIPPDLPTHCDGCEARFTISHSLDCKKGGLVTARHNELRDGVADLAGKAFTPSHVRSDPLIYSGRAMSRMKPKPAGSNIKNPIGETTAAPEVTEQKGDVLIRDLWQQGTDSVHNMRVMNTDALSYVKKTPEKCLHKAEKGKNCRRCWRQASRYIFFFPLLASCRHFSGVFLTCDRASVFMMHMS